MGVGTSMRARARRAVIASAIAVVATSVVACVPGDAAPPDRGIAVSGPPPQPRTEPAPPPPAATNEMAWVPGYWHWIGDRYAWVPGHWEKPPRGARTWRPPHYGFHDGTYSYEAGGWVQR